MSLGHRKHRIGLAAAAVVAGVLWLAPTTAQASGFSISIGGPYGGFSYYSGNRCHPRQYGYYGSSPYSFRPYYGYYYGGPSLRYRPPAHYYHRPHGHHSNHGHHGGSGGHHSRRR